MKKFLSLLIIFFSIGSNAGFAASSNQLKDEAIMLYSVNKINEAKELFLKIPIDERDAETWLLLSNIYEDLQDELNAENFLQFALQKDPKYYKAYYNLGIRNFNRGQIDTAINNFKTALKYNKKNSYIYTNLGCCYLAKKNLLTARIYFNKAVTLNPQNPTNYYNLAYIYKEKGKEDKAQELIEIYNKLMQEKIN
ncbi:tetratricopeptide repeat protein [bacterium]|nr:tetratricopeptide repeat protein [bacterium]